MVKFFDKLQKRLSVGNTFAHFCTLHAPKRCYDVTLSRQEGSTMRHLANAHSVTSPAGSIYRTSFSGVWRDRSRRLVKQLSIG